MDNEGNQQQRSNNEDVLHSLLGPDDQMNIDHANVDDNNDDVYITKPEMPSKRPKRHTAEQIQELKAAYKQCDHPDEKTRRALGAKIGLEARQVRFWFQNRRAQMQAKAQVQDTKTVQQEHAALMAENISLRHAMLAKSCVTCSGGTTPAEPTPEKRRLLAENARLRSEHMRATAFLHKILVEAEAPLPSGRPVLPSTSIHSMLSVAVEGRDALLRHAEASMDQFLMLVTKGEPVWVPTPDGEVLSYHAFQKRMVPLLLEACSDGFVREATRETGMVRGAAAHLVGILTDANRWSETFPGVVAGVTAGDVISGGVCSSHNGLIQLMNADLWVQSPRLRNRSVNLLRYSKLTAEGHWAVMDVSVDGILELEGSGKVDLNVDSDVMQALQKGCRLLPSGCLVEDMGNGYCKVTWVVHAEYDETTVPTMFKPLFRSGKAHGAQRWLASLQRHCEYLAALHSSHFPPSSHNPGAISPMGRRGVMELAQRMMASFYSAVSGPVTQPSSSIVEWHGSDDAGAERIDAAVRMVTWKKAVSVDGEPAGVVLSASTTVWLPSTPPQLVFEYLCDGQRRGEWDTFANGAAVEELGSVATGHLAGNAVSVLCPKVTDGINSKMLILQEARTDVSCSMVVYAPVEKETMRAVMNGGDHVSVFLLPSGFAVLPDGHGKARCAPCTSRAPVGDDNDNTAGSLLTVACQALLPGSPSGDQTAKAFDDVGGLLCRAIKKIKAAVNAKIVIASLM